MTVAAAMQDLDDRTLRYFGDESTVTLRKFVSLRNANDGSPLHTLSVNGLTSSGATSIDLDAPGLEGDLLAGVTFTIAGDVTTYTVAADVSASGSELSGVTFTPALVTDAADDAAVTVGKYLEQTLAAELGVVSSEEADGTLVRMGDRKVWVTAKGSSWVPDEDTDVLIGSERFKVIAARHFDSGGGSQVFELVVGVR